MATGVELVDLAWALLRRVHPRQRRDCYWVMNRATWYKLLTLADPKFRHVVERNSPPYGDMLFGKPVVVADQVDVDGLHLVTSSAARGSGILLPGINAAIDEGIASEPVPAVRRIPPHPQTQAINDEFGWGDAHEVTFSD